VDASAAELDEEEHVQPLQRDRLDGEEVDREHARGLRSEEGTPRQPGTLARRAETGLPQDFPHGRGGDAGAESVQLARYSLVAPARILAPTGAPIRGSRRRSAAARRDGHMSSAEQRAASASAAASSA
jgi:hypothetical protein